MPASLMAGAAAVDITPRTPQFLFGYPHVHRISTGVHDPLLSSALFLSDGRTPLFIIANDIIFASKASTARVRTRIQERVGVPAGHIMVTATHTHSGPITADMISNEADPVVPKADPAYIQQFEDGIVEAAARAFRQARPAEIGLAVADGSCVGTNRHDPNGPSDPQVPVLVVRDAESRGYIAVMTVCSMHPTVLHEDSTLVSGDFPAMMRQYLQAHLLGEATRVGSDARPPCPLIYHTGPCGDQSPRHVTRANTFEEASRLGTMLGESVARAIRAVQFRGDGEVAVATRDVDLPRRSLPALNTARDIVAQAAARLEQLRFSGAPRGEVRTAECDLFGAEETLTLASAAASGALNRAAAAVMPAEIMAVRVGPWKFIGWPGEAYVEFALAVKTRRPDCHVISLANGELQGYLVTQQAVEQRRYEALNAVFASPDSGNLLVSKTLELLEKVS